mgnify:FL=1|tara:strand:- start:3879 stop:4748 length:870 start_codon:yes stop_codon:yes gene_type:complete
MKFLKFILDSIIFFINLINKLFSYLFKLSFIGYFKEQLEKKCYIEKKILDKEISFFCPNKTTEWRVKTFFKKEPETIEWINNFVNDKSLVLWDIGANIGLYSIYASLRFDRINVVAFEPSTSNLRVLSRNISINSLCEKIKIVSQPLNDEKYKFSIFNESSFQEGGALNTFKEKFNFTGKDTEFENRYYLLGTSINQLLDDKVLEIPDYIKIDVDGIEHLILMGAEKYLNNKKIKSILIEVNENFERQFTKIKNIMENSNFKLVKKERNEDFYQISDFKKMYNYIYVKK